MALQHATSARATSSSACSTSAAARHHAPPPDARSSRHAPHAAAAALAASIACSSLLTLALPASAQLVQGPGVPGPLPAPTAQHLHSQRWRQPQQQPGAPPAAAPNVRGDVAGFLPFQDDERDPIEPFTLFGTTTKKYAIEELQGEKIVSRRRGVTVNTCVASVSQSQESPAFNSLQPGEKVRVAGNQVCEKTEGADLKPVCKESCANTCSAGLAKWAKTAMSKTGFALTPGDAGRLVRACTRECAYNCAKEGKSYDFVAPYRK